MIYTIGHSRNYKEALEREKRVLKAEGGYVFFSIADAQKCICELGKCAEWDVFGLKTTLENTQPVNGECWYELKTPAEIFLLKEGN